MELMVIEVETFSRGMRVEEGFHVFKRVDGHADFADFAESERMVGVHADLRGEIEGHREAGLALAQEVAVTLIGFGGAAETGVLAHGPEAAAIHGGVDAAGVGKFAGEAEGVVGIPVREIRIRIEIIEGRAGESREGARALGGGSGGRGGIFLEFRIAHIFLARRKEVTEKKAKMAATTMGRATSQ